MDHRRDTRVDGCFPILIRDQSGNHYTALTANLGRSGLFCHLLGENFTLKQPVQIEFTPPQTSALRNHKVSMAAQVVRVKETGIAIEFDTLKATQQDAVQSLRHWLSRGSK